NRRTFSRADSTACIAHRASPPRRRRRCSRASGRSRTAPSRGRPRPRRPTGPRKRFSAACGVLPPTQRRERWRSRVCASPRLGMSARLARPESPERSLALSAKIQVGNTVIHRIVEQEAPFFPAFTFFPTLSKELYEENKAWLQPAYIDASDRVMLCIQSYL